MSEYSCPAQFREFADLVDVLRKNTYGLNGFETQYEQARSLGWSAIRQDPTNRRLYKMLFDLEHAYRQWQQLTYPEDQQRVRRAHEHFDAETYRLYELALQHDPSWAEAHAYLGVLDTESERFEMARRRFWEGLTKGDNASEITCCFYHYLSLSPLWLAAQWPQPKACALLDGIPIPTILDSSEADWRSFQAHIPSLAERCSADVVDTCNMIDLALLRGRTGWSLLSANVPDTYLANLGYQHLQRMMWPMLMHPYEPSQAAQILGLQELWSQAEALQRLQLDFAFQRLLLQLDIDEETVQAEQAVFTTGTPGKRDRVVVAQLLAGDFDSSIAALRFLVQRCGREMKGTLSAYEHAWRHYVTEEDRVRQIEAVELDWSSDVEANDTLRALVCIARDQMRFLRWALVVYEDPLIIVDLVRRVAGSQPWLARLLAGQSSLRLWLEKADLFDTFEGDSRLLEIDSFLAKHKTEMLDRGGSTPWTEMIEDMERVVEALETQLAKSQETSLFPEIERALGQHIWEWLDQDTRLFIHEAELRHRREVLRSDDLETENRDHTGEYVLYHKALEVTLTRALCSPFGQVKERSKQLYKLGKALDKACQTLPREASGWCELLAERMEILRNLRNESMHRHCLPYESYMEMRHLVIGSRYSGSRTISMFWLAYALCSLLQEGRAVE